MKPHHKLRRDLQKLIEVMVSRLQPFKEAKRTLSAKAQKTNFKLLASEKFVLFCDFKTEIERLLAMRDRRAAKGLVQGMYPKEDLG